MLVIAKYICLVNNRKAEIKTLSGKGSTRHEAIVHIKKIEHLLEETYYKVWRHTIKIIE